MLAKKANCKRVLSSFLALVMLLGLLPTSVLAAETSGKIEYQKEDWTYSADGKVAHKKTIEKTGENKFDITLSVKTMEEIKEQVVSPDAAVVLVMDVSNSMKETVDGRDPKHESEQRIYKAKEAAENFIDSFAANAGDAQRQVAIVEFGSSAYTVQGWTDADLAKTAVDQVGINFRYPACTIQGSHTHDVNTIEWGGFLGLQWRCNVKGCQYYKDNTWGGLGWFTLFNRGYEGHTHENTFDGPHGNVMSDGGGTNIEGGLKLADNLLNSSAVSNIGNRYVVLITDGIPTYHMYQGRDNSSTTFIEGQSGGGSYAARPDYENVPNVANAIKDDAMLYTVSYASAYVKETVGGKKIDAWLSSFANKNIVAGEDIDWGLGQISQIIQNQSKAWILTDPIPAANFITFSFDDNTNIPDYAVNPDSVLSYNGETGQLVWNLKGETPVGKETEGNVTWYTYETKYTIRLNTAAQGFVEDHAYATNGTTTLTYMLTENGEVQPDLKSTDLVVPQVSGTVPEYTYKVEYYKQGDATKGDYANYTKADTVTGPATDLWTAVDIQNVDAGYQTKYDTDHYHYAKGDPASITISAVEANNVIKLYYDRDVANVTVNHYYKTDKYAADGTFTAGTYTDQPQTSSTQSGYVGDQFTAEKALNYNGALYTFDKGSDTITVNKDAAKNVINLYYTRTVDGRADASVVVNHVYRTHTWTLENGKYVLKESTQNENQVEESAGLKATTTYTAKTNPVEGYEDFTYDASSVNSITLKEGQNVITLYFDKTVDDRQAVSLAVKHHYTKTVVTIGQDGKPVTTVDPDDHVETVTVEAYKGETVTVSEQNTYGGDTYTSDSGNAAKLTLTDVKGGEEINLYYTIHQAPETTSVTVNHIYRTITHETVETTDDEGNVTGTEVKDSTKTDDTDDVTVNDLYVGQSYTAAQMGREGYTFNEQESDALTAAVQANGATVINLYYDRDEDKDDRDEATISVKHVYTTHLTTIVNGEVKTIDVNDGEETEATVTGKAGDSFTATAKTTYNGKDYTVVGTPDLDVVLQPGTNSTIVINYERSASDLVKTGYTVEYIYNTYTMEIVNGVAQYGEPDTEMDTTPFNDGYVGQMVTISDGAKDGFTADPANPATTQTLKESGNLYTFVYNKYVPLDKVSVTVNHHYTTTTIAVDGSSSQSTDDVTGTPVEKYVGEDYVAQVAANGFTCDRYTVTDGITATQDETTKNVTLTASGDVVVDFYYSKTVDNSKPVNYSIQHVYVTINWDGTRTVTRGEPITGSSYATKQLSAATDNNGGNYKLVSAYFNDQTMPGFDPADPQDTYAVTLVDGANVIVYTYERNVDTRQSTQVMVIHNYYARDTYTDDDAMSDADYIAQEGVQPEYRTEAVYESFQDGIWVGQEYTATMYNIVYFKDEEGAATIERVYDLVNADPEGGKIASIAALDEGKIPAGNIVTFNLIRDYSTDPGDISYKVIHQYYHNGELVGSVETTGTGKVGSTVNTADITKLTTYNEETYEYVSADKDAITLAADAANNVITLRYESNTSVGPSVTRYDLVVRYLEQGTEEELASAYRTTLRRGDDYDVTSRTEREIDGYVIVDVTGDAVSGTMNSDKEITVWYEADGTDIGDDDTPLGPQPGTDPDDGNNPGGNVPGDGGETDIGEGETPLNPTPDTGNDGTGTGSGTGTDTAADPGDAGVDIGEGETPLGDLPQTGMAAAPVSPAGTAGLVALSMSMAALGLYFTFGRKKDEEEN